MINPEDQETKNALEVIFEERKYQDLKWGDRQHSVGEWVLILQKLADDAKKAWVSNNGDIKALSEVRQIAATALACMQQCGSIKRDLQEQFRR